MRGPARGPGRPTREIPRETFKPSVSHDRPLAILGTQVVCADNDAEAERLAQTFDLNAVRRAKGEYLD